MRQKIQMTFMIKLLCCLFLPAMLMAGELDNQKLIITIPHLKTAPKLENFLGMKPGADLEKQMAKVSNFIQREPVDGVPASQQTDVYLGYDAKNLYAVFVAHDSDPNKIRATMSHRENIFGDDIVEIMLDTFQDERRAYAFIANPLGIQFDATWSENQGFDRSFDTLWHSKGRLTDTGYLVWMAIPFKSLRFPSTNEQTWGILLGRDINRDSRQETFWPQNSSKISGRLNQAGTLTGLKNISPGRNVQFIPYATYRAFRVLDEDANPGPQFIHDNLDATTGLDTKLVLKDKFALDLTVNPDFNQVESDEPQVTVNQRFEVFFPEKRPFFLENANYFQTPINLVFTRRIADPQFGGRLTGKAGAYALGALLINEEAAGKQVESNSRLYRKNAVFGIARISRDIFNQSTIGLTYTDREFEQVYNRVAGLDARIKLNKNWTASTQSVFSFSRDENESTLNGTALDLQLNRSGHHLSTHSHYRQFTPDFQTQAGFVNRVDIRNMHHFVSYTFRPESKLVTTWQPGLFVNRIWDFAGTRLDDSVSPRMNFEFSGQNQMEIGYSYFKERLRPVDFSTLSANKDFSEHNWRFELNSRTFDKLNVNAEVSVGTAINFVPAENEAPALANRFSGEFGFTVKPFRTLKIDNTYLLTRFTQKGTSSKIFTNHILRSRWNWQPNRQLSLRFIFDYNATLVNPAFTSLGSEKQLNIDFLLTYLVNPWTALYVGTNYNYRNIDLVRRMTGNVIVPTRNDFLNDGRQFFVKYSYLFRI